MLVLRTEIVCFDYMNELYSLDDDFQHVWEKCKWHGSDGEFHILEGFLFKRKCLCVPNTSLREHVIRELHGGGFRAHLGRGKTVRTYIMWLRDIIGLGLNEMLSILFEVVLRPYSKYRSLYGFASAEQYMRRSHYGFCFGSSNTKGERFYICGC